MDVKTEHNERDKRQESSIESMYEQGALGKTECTLEMAKKLHKAYHDSFDTHKE